MRDTIEDIIDEYSGVWEAMSKSISCGYCGAITTVESEYTCRVCGRMLCEGCGETVGLCEDHMGEDLEENHW